MQTRLAWATSIPDDWRVVPLKYACKFTTGWTPPTGDSEAYVGDNLWANISDIGPREIHDTVKRLSDDAVQRHSIARSPKGSLLFSFKLSIGQVSFAGVDMYTNEAIATFTPNDSLNLNFAYYAFPEMIVRNATENIYGAKMLNQQLINSASLVLPPAPEQAAIAAFLDRETGKIDALVEEQRRLIELLKEKRQAVISHAVTKGLDPLAKMKSSGVEWLGDVPEHWELKRLSHLAKRGTSITYGIVQAGPDVEDGVPYIRTSDMSGDELPSEGYQRTSTAIDEAYARSRVHPGDVVIAIRATIGKPLLVPPSLAHANLTQGTAKFTPGENVLGEYVCHFLRCNGAVQEFSRLGKGATFKEITLEMLRKFPVICPPLEEQAAICNWLKVTLATFDQLIEAATSASMLLAERRAALISAAVTGKIDVQPASGRVSVPIDRARLRTTVAAEIVDLLSHKRSFGRVKLQKLLYLAEAEAGIMELQGQYLREAAGPLDRTLIAEVDAGLQQDQHVTIVQPDGPGSQVVYQLRGERGAYHEELVASIGDRATTLRALIEKLGDLDTKSVEAVTTLYAVWNDALLDHEEPTDAIVVSGVLEDWHPEKATKFKAEELLTWLGWMRRNKLVPRGNGPRTITGRLFV